LKETALRVRTARDAAGLSEAEAAARAGLNQAAWYDLESHDDEMEISLSLREVQAVADVLNTYAVWLLTGQTSPPLQPVAPSDIVASIRSLLTERRISTAEYETLVGWNITDALENPTAAWNWNVAALRDICASLELDYRAFLLHEDQDAAS
jgi:transcriptional regulator with XRE-family HTH domain